MEWSNNFSLSHLFLTHEVVITSTEGRCEMHIPSLRELTLNPFFYQILQLLDGDQLEVWKKVLHEDDAAEILRRLMCDPQITNLKEFSSISTLIREHMTDILPKFGIKERQLYVGDVPLTKDLLIEVFYLLRLGMGQKVEKPIHFGPDEEQARLFYERAEAAKRKAEKIRAANQSDDNDSLMQLFVMVNYKFPVYSIEQMYDMTFAQLRYLQQTAASMISYEHNMSAYVAGNLKKAPSFFLK